MSKCGGSIKIIYWFLALLASLFAAFGLIGMVCGLTTSDFETTGISALLFMFFGWMTGVFAYLIAPVAQDRIRRPGRDGQWVKNATLVACDKFNIMGVDPLRNRCQSCNWPYEDHKESWIHPLVWSDVITDTGKPFANMHWVTKPKQVIRYTPEQWAKKKKKGLYIVKPKPVVE